MIEKGDRVLLTALGTIVYVKYRYDDEGNETSLDYCHVRQDNGHTFTVFDEELLYKVVPDDA